jgi:hypothetical protein
MDAAASEKPQFVAVNVNDVEWRRPKTPAGDPMRLTYCVALETFGAPIVQMTAYEPGWTSPRHRHVEDEILLMTEGDLDIGGTVHTAPSVVYVPRGVLYGPLTAGPKGAKFYRVPFKAGTFKEPHTDNSTISDD